MQQGNFCKLPAASRQQRRCQLAARFSHSLAGLWTTASGVSPQTCTAQDQSASLSLGHTFFTELNILLQKCQELAVCRTAFGSHQNQVVG